MLNQGDIVLVPFPFTDQSGTKFRPAIIISNPKVNKTNDVILAQITSTIRKDEFSYVLENRNLSIPLHKKDCEVRCHIITAISKSLIKMKISALNQDKHIELINKIMDNFK